MAKYTVIFQRKTSDFPYFHYCEVSSVERYLETNGIEEDEILFIFKGWPRRVLLYYWNEDIGSSIPAPAERR